MGQVSKIHNLIENESDAKNVYVKPENVAYATQTTLSIDDTEKILNILKKILKLRDQVLTIFVMQQLIDN